MFKLTLKRSDDKEMEPYVVKRIMYLLYQNFDLLDEPDLCNMPISDFLEDDRKLRKLTFEINGRDWPSQIKGIGSLILVGENRSGDNCPNCGYPEYYYIGGRMLCNQCEHSERAEPDINDEDPLGSYEGRVVINNR